MHTHDHTPTPALTRFAWLSIAASVVTIALKMGAYAVTGSVGLLSDGLESIVNVVAAVLTLVMLWLAARPPDEEHAYGHTKAEYFASGVEGALIVLAACSIIYSSVGRLMAPQPIEAVGVGLALSSVASVLNFVVARVLLRASRTHGSVALEADAHHLLTDVWTSIGVVVGIGLTIVTGWLRLDAIVALLVGANIIWTGFQLVKRSALGLLDTSLPGNELAQIQRVLDTYTSRGITFHALLTRQAGVRRFVSVHVLVPGAWSVQRGHLLLEQVEADIRAAVPNTTVFTHLEPLEDPTSWQDVTLDRRDADAVA